MENKETMNLQQKLIAISNEMPKLLKKHYSDEVDYDFVKIDDIFELLNPAFTKYHICLQELEETDATYSKVEVFDPRINVRQLIRMYGLQDTLNCFVLMFLQKPPFLGIGTEAEL